MMIDVTTALTGHADWVYGCSFSPDGRLLVTYPPDSLKTLQVWDISALGVGPQPKPAPIRLRPTKPAQDIYTPLHSHLRTLPLAHATLPTPARPAYWLRGAGAVGARLPLCLAQDLGALLTQPRPRLTLARPAHLP